MALPRHVAIIMDGNGRWARERGLPRAAGHKAGIAPVRLCIEQCARRGVEALTLFAFSSENWSRPAGGGQQPDGSVRRCAGPRGRRAASQRRAPALHRRTPGARGAAAVADRCCRAAHRRQRGPEAADRGQLWRPPGHTQRRAARGGALCQRRAARGRPDGGELRHGPGSGRPAGSGPAGPHRRRAAHQ